MKKFVVILLAITLLISSVSAFAEAGVVKTSLTTGLETAKEDKILVVQMDNEPGARPQKGMSNADIVYEIELYNGGYTRYTAVFNDNIPELVEAVRSTRIVNIDTYLEYGGCFIHFGGQQDEGSNIYNYVKKVPVQARYDGLSDSKNFYRDKERKKPNNVVCKMQQIYEDVDWSVITASSPLKFSYNGFTSKGESVTSFEVNYRDSYKPSYVFNAETGLYMRSYNGNPQIDPTTDTQYSCSNVIVEYMTYNWYDGASDRPNVTTVGTNKCDYFINGMHFTGYWVRNAVTENTTYYDDEGVEVVFKAGKTFIQTLKDTKEVTIAE